MATSDSLFHRYRDDYLKRLNIGDQVKLVHGMAWLRDENELSELSKIGESEDDRMLAMAWFRPTRRAMLATHGVGTVDQAMLAGMNVKFGFLRLYGLKGKVLVIDEVHAYDAYMTAIIERLLSWCSCMNIPVILLSATLSSDQRKRMIDAYGAKNKAVAPDAPYPLITVAQPELELKTYETKASRATTLGIELHPGMLDNVTQTAELACKLVSNGGCCCVILNTVKQAQDVYSSLKLPENEKLLFHARFTASDRLKIAEKVLRLFGKDPTNRPERFVLVATQVVEQSLDVDFDHMISEIAPIDLLLQRSGRMHRHRNRIHHPILHVLTPNSGSHQSGSHQFGGTGYVYARKTLLRTLAILSEARKVHLPADFRKLIERCYGSGTWNQSAVPWQLIQQADQEWIADVQEMAGRARQLALCEPRPQGFRPVNNDPTGDDSDDGNGWRGGTRLGANDVSAVLVDPSEVQSLKAGKLDNTGIQNLYKRVLKVPSYIPLDKPAPGFDKAVQAGGRLRGLTLLPVVGNKWRCAHTNGRNYEISYDSTLGLLARRMP